jgi:hypothetical protein
MKRSAVGLAEIADLHNLAAAFHAAARGKRGRGDVEAFRDNLDRELSALQAGLLAGTLSPAPMRRFRIHDPKPRLIHAPCFRDRVVHQAIMAHVGPVLDRTLVFDTYACRAGKGTLAAVQRASAHARPLRVACADRCARLLCQHRPRDPAGHARPAVQEPGTDAAADPDHSGA